MSVAATTKALGIHQSDIIIRSAIVEGIRDLRRNPWLLDYCFASLAQDLLTAGSYGEKDISQAKKWFAGNNLPVFMDTRVDSAKLPAISISLRESVEVENTHADVHYDPTEDADADWPILAGPFSPTSYSGITGAMEIPASAVSELILAPGMLILDSVGTSHEILQVLDSTNEATALIQIDTGISADFRKAVIKGASPRMITALESANFRETYSIGCHAQGEAVQLTYLHSIVTFLLLRYRQDLLEARGFERSTLASSPFTLDQKTEAEIAFVRYITITGYCRQVWPKTVTGRLEAADTGIIVSKPGTSASITFDSSGTSLWTPDEE